MRIGIHNSDNTNYPNLALMKLSAYHKSKGDEVDFYSPLFAPTFDKVYSSKVFTYMPDKSSELIGNVVKGGIGYRLFNTLPDEIEHICPDYLLFKTDYSLGFLTRGCLNKCSWCIVPRKEGNIRPNADIDEFLRHKSVVLMDNNVLACNHGINQIQKLVNLNVKVDFNQGIDARLIDDKIARILAKIKWIKTIRLSCDNQKQMSCIQKAVTLLRWHNIHPKRIFVYCMITDDIDEALERVKFLKGIMCEPFVQPFIDHDNYNEPTQQEKNFARWVNQTAIFNSVDWEKYSRTVKNRKCNNPNQLEMFND